MDIFTPDNSRRLAKMVQGLEPEDRWALLDRAEEGASFKELEQEQARSIEGRLQALDNRLKQ